MTNHRTGTRDEWLEARLDLLKAEKELTRLNDDLTRRRVELPWVRVEKDYVFDTEDGEASLADLFRGRSQLLVYHFMYGPDWDEGCPSCSGVADGFDETHLHLQNHDVAFTAVSGANSPATDPLQLRRYNIEPYPPRTFELVLAGACDLISIKDTVTGTRARRLFNAALGTSTK